MNATVLAMIREAAQAGNAQAQYRLGMMYGDGDGVGVDLREAVHWISRAAEQGHGEAQGALGWFYDNGFGVRQDSAVAAAWYTKSAQQGVARSQYRLAGMYRAGSHGLGRDIKTMLSWYHRAAEQDFAPAQSMLGRLMMRGREVARDALGAFQWLSLAVINGSESARQALEELVGEMTPAQLEEARGLLLTGLEARGVDVAPLRDLLPDSERAHHLL